MGTLDDAIREHLELKKRHGAPEEEVKRLEHEAFGPARREAPQPAREPDEPDEAPDAEGPEETEDELQAEPEAAAAPEPAPVPAPAPDEPWLDDDPDEVPFGDRLDHRTDPGATTEFTAAEAEEAGGKPPSDYVAPDEEGEGEDLLEETPDFLQETPEHDRLWFEQRPPKDFDFDE